MEWSKLREFGLGGLAACCAGFFTNPLEVLFVKSQRYVNFSIRYPFKIRTLGKLKCAKFLKQSKMGVSINYLHSVNKAKDFSLSVTDRFMKNIQILTEITFTEVH